MPGRTFDGQQKAHGEHSEQRDFHTSSFMCCSSACRSALCCLLTCGLSRRCHTCPFCLSPVPLADSHKAETTVLQEPSAHKLVGSDSFRYPDLQIAGKRVLIQPAVCCPTRRLQHALRDKAAPLRPVSSSSLYSMGATSDGSSEDDMDIDSLISKKLLELYSQHQIEQLAQCTSDSVFLSRSSIISQLISDIRQEHALEEQEAECRLVHGIIRLSTRKERRRPTSSQASKRDETLPDSGHDTMMPVSLEYSFTHYEAKISEQNSTDRMARQLRVPPAHSPSSAQYWASGRDSDPASSCTPLLKSLST